MFRSIADVLEEIRRERMIDQAVREAIPQSLRPVVLADPKNWTSAFNNVRMRFRFINLEYERDFGA